MRRIRKILEKILGLEDNYKISYSQCGEDIIISFLFNRLKISNPSYLDIGAHHPTYLNNTFLLYQKGCKGVCIEPDPILFEEIKKARKRDVCLNFGIGIENKKEVDFYIMTTRTLNTFSKDEAERYQSYGNQKIEKIIKIPTITLNEAVEKFFPNSKPNLISLDVEGWELAILKTFDFDKFRPEILCIETLTYTEDNTERKITEIIDFVKSKNYLVYADTYINTIFLDKNLQENK